MGYWSGLRAKDVTVPFGRQLALQSDRNKKATERNTMPRRRNFDISDSIQMCPECNGAGTVPDPRWAERMMECPLCHGVGRVSSGNADRAALSRYRKKQAAATKAAVKAEIKEQEKLEEEPRKPRPSRRLREAQQRNQ